MESMSPTYAVPADYVKSPGMTAMPMPEAKPAAMPHASPGCGCNKVSVTAPMQSHSYNLTSMILVLFVLLVIICRIWPAIPLAVARTSKK